MGEALEDPCRVVGPERHRWIQAQVFCKEVYGVCAAVLCAEVRAHLNLRPQERLLAGLILEGLRSRPVFRQLRELLFLLDLLLLPLLPPTLDLLNLVQPGLVRRPCVAIARRTPRLLRHLLPPHKSLSQIGVPERIVLVRVPRPPPPRSQLLPQPPGLPLRLLH